jgi:hypothetical protein
MRLHTVLRELWRDLCSRSKAPLLSYTPAPDHRERVRALLAIGEKHERPSGLWPL